MTNFSVCSWSWSAWSRPFLAGGGAGAGADPIRLKPESAPGLGTSGADAGAA